jgi:hypothetical protein
VALAGLTSTAIRMVLGTSSCRRPSRLVATSMLEILMPVALPPGRATSHEPDVPQFLWIVFKIENPGIVRLCLNAVGNALAGSYNLVVRCMAHGEVHFEVPPLHREHLVVNIDQTCPWRSALFELPAWLKGQER